MSTKSDRRAAREVVAGYHEEQLAGLVRHIKSAVERFDAGELDAFEIDEVVFQYSQAARKLWKFCNLQNMEIAARIIRDEPPSEWWELGARRRR